MNCRNKLSVLALFAILSTCITKAGISDSIIVLDQVTAKAVKFGGTTAGAKLYSVDSLTLKLYQSGSLADLLRNQSMIALKSYGSGGLAVVSIRGGSSRQTAIIWNGFNIRSPMNGELNFSSLPAGFIDRIMIQTGGSTTMYGSGAACGVIYLSNHLSMKNRGWHGSLNNEIGSFGSFGTLASASFSTQNVSTRIKIAYQHADNDFIFKN
jgi:vitamin B12 transporter